MGSGIASDALHRDGSHAAAGHVLILAHSGSSLVGIGNCHLLRCAVAGFCFAQCRRPKTQNSKCSHPRSGHPGNALRWYGGGDTSCRLLSQLSALNHAISISDLGVASVTLVTVLMLGLVFVTSTVDRKFTRQSVALEGSEQRYRRIVESTFDAFMAMDDTGMITDWSTQAEVMFGWSRA